jgi:hypothetical protein
MPASRVLELPYEDVVADPRAVVTRVVQRLAERGAEAHADLGSIPARLGSSNVRRVGSSDFAAIERAVRGYSGAVTN